ncbi:MAG: hypothetical protein QW203_07410 [Thermoplasmatales archaeon]
MVTVNPSSITVTEAGVTAAVLTTIDWTASTQSLPSSGGSVTFTITCYDQNGNPIPNVSGIQLLEGGVYQGTFPATNSSGQSSFTLTIPSNTSTSSESLVFTLGTGSASIPVIPV